MAQGPENSFQTCGALSQIIQFMDGRFVQSYEAGLQYQGGLRAIRKAVYAKYRLNKEVTGQSGYLTVRFLVNCHGQTGKYEVLQVDENFKNFNFNNLIKDQIMEIVVDLDGWIPGRNTRREPVDCQKFLTFKIRNGQVIDVLPK